jgi:hypothetical protein
MRKNERCGPAIVTSAMDEDAGGVGEDCVAAGTSDEEDLSAHQALGEKDKAAHTTVNVNEPVIRRRGDFMAWFLLRTLTIAIGQDKP